MEDGDFQFFERLADTQPWPEEMVEQAERRQSVRLALEKLIPEQRVAVVMRYYLELSEAEMSA